MEERFKWPKGTQAELKVYPQDHPQRRPTEEYFANQVRRDITDVRSGREYANLWLLIESLQDLSDPKPQNSGFHSWLWAIEGVLGADACRQIGERVCSEEGFTVEEGEHLVEVYRSRKAKDCDLPETASWEEIGKVLRARELEKMERANMTG